MADLADDLIGEIRLGRGGRGRFRNTSFGKARRGAAGASLFSARARNLWRVGQASNAAVLKKINRGGTHTGAQLAAQLDYLFGKSAAVFGNAAELEWGARSLTDEQRKDMALDWEDAWSGEPKNGHTTHLLLSFPADLSPRKALRIAEDWAFEMFQSGTHVDDQWSYVAALHTDRDHPHVHIVLNNRGLHNDEWFYIARDNVFCLDMMKERLVGLASDMGVELDASSRLERGILTYGPTRAEIEGAAREKRRVHERKLHGKALEDGLAVVEQSAATLRMLASIASLSRLKDVALRMERAAEILKTGGILTPKSLEIANMDLEKAETRKELDHVFTSWLDKAEQQISTLDPADRREMRQELSEITTDIMRDLGDARGAELVMRAPRSELYKTQVLDDEIRRGKTVTALDEGEAHGVRSAVFEAAEAIGIERATMERRLEHPAANAWQEREWVKQDLHAVAQARGLDLDHEDQRHAAADLVDRFYATAAKTLNTALEIDHSHSHENDRLTRTLESLAAVHREHGRVAFEHEDHAERFATDLKERYGEKVIEQIAAGDDRALALDFPEPSQRRDISKALVAAAESHESIGLSMRQAELAKERLHERDEPQHEMRRKDHDLEL
ncbi:relaxase/mobilization nuclease domain-containing protein [Paracoccus sp. YIM 132242]|uniref:Relaxase/mobilization nuclease domain-containing protein n=1 Tax=Paracoccus lichenicola TaxID=2665644 RepID=A0A6L6HTT0_9RHOB|nr:relaxase/mobilization nuclease domain-containing protein [Paracoccus lichenicola]MTE01690.1 relaxase/mobilization nuclease domain-containing protein [Paracoccus lichenicola]